MEYLWLLTHKTIKLVLCVHTYVDTRLTLGLCPETYKLGYYRNSNVKGMGFQVKWYPCQYSGVDPDSEERGGIEWRLVGVYITHMPLRPPY